MVSTKVQLVPASNRLVSSGTNHKRKVCIHQTGNTGRGADAQAHANLQSRGNSRRASWQWTVDDKIAIQSYRHNDRCWHSGTTAGNSESIAIEICINSDGDYRKALENGAELAARILKNEGLSIGDLVTHNSYSGAECPRQIRAGQSGINWSDFVGMVRSAFGGSSSSAPSGGSSSSGSSSSGKSVSQLAQEVIDGKHGNGDARRRSLGSQYSAVQAEVNRRLSAGSSSGNPSSSGSSSRQTAEQVAQDIANGRGNWGNDPERSRKLRSAGYDAAAIQRRVNAILSGNSGSSSSGGSSSSNRQTAEQVAQDIANGRGNWGNDPQRSQRLRNAGYDSAAIQRRVNAILSGGGSSSGSSSRPAPTRLTVAQVAQQIINGQGGWGNDPQRSQRLRAAGYNPQQVQAEVNRRV